MATAEDDPPEIMIAPSRWIIPEADCRAWSASVAVSPSTWSMV